MRDVDIVLTTRELARILKTKNIVSASPAGRKLRFDNRAKIPEQRLSSGETGGVMEAAVRTAYYPDHRQ